MSDTQWAKLKNLKPITAFLSKNETQKKKLLSALRSSSGRKVDIGRLLASHIERFGDASNVDSYLSQALQAADARQTVSTLRSSLLRHELTGNAMPNDDRGASIDPENKPNAMPAELPKIPHNLQQNLTNTREREATQAPDSSDIPTTLGQLNTTVGELNTILKDGDLAGKEKHDPGALQLAMAAKAMYSTKDKMLEYSPDQVKKENVDRSDPFTRSSSAQFQNRDEDVMAGGQLRRREGETNKSLAERTEQQKREVVNNSFGDAQSKENAAFDQGKGQGLREMFKEAAEEDVEENPKLRVASNVEFDLFSHVPPGYSNGIDNSLYRMDVNRKRTVEWMNPMYTHRQYQGPENGQKPMPYQWQDEMSAAKQIEAVRQMGSRHSNITLAKRGGHFSVLPSDSVYTPSSKGLRSRTKTYFKKQIDLTTPFHNVATPAGRYLNNVRFKPYETHNDRHNELQNNNYTGPNINTLPAVYGYQTTRDVNWMQ
jgi:hypothetical protein